jgi:hypothetical protein
MLNKIFLFSLLYNVFFINQLIIFKKVCFQNLSSCSQKILEYLNVTF